MRRRKLRERLLTYILCLAMVIALLPVNAITVQAEGVPQCKHCGGTGKVCNDHKGDVHNWESYENKPECKEPCVIIPIDNHDYCYTHDINQIVQCEYCKGTGKAPGWTHDHNFVYEHFVDGNGTHFHLFVCDYPRCGEQGNAPGHGQNCNTDGLDGACSYCGFKAEAPAHTHTKGTHHAPVAATCTNPGVVEYWDCSCGEKLDASGNVLASTEVAATGNHDFLDEGSANYNGEKCSLCNVKNIASSSLDIKATSTTYTGKEQTAVITGIETENYTVTGNTATNAGKYTITLTGKGDYTGTREVEWTITKATPTVISPTSANPKYAGESVKLVNPGSTDFGKMLYSLGDDDYSEEIPCADKGGDYTVYYEVEGSDNWSGAAGSVEIQVPVRVDVTVVGDGSVSGYDPDEFYPVGTVLTLTAESDEDYRFAGWDDDFEAPAERLWTVQPDARDNELTVNFQQKTHDFSVSVNETIHKCADCDATENHVFANDSDTTCDVCGYVRTVTEENPTSDEVIYEVDINGIHHVKYDEEAEMYICQDKDCGEQIEPGYYDVDGEYYASYTRPEYGLRLAKYALLGDLEWIDRFLFEAEPGSPVEIVDLHNVTGADYIDLFNCVRVRIVNVGSLFDCYYKYFTKSSIEKVIVHSGNPANIEVNDGVEIIEAPHTYIVEDSELHFCSVCYIYEKHDFSDDTCQGECACGVKNEAGNHNFSVSVNETTHKCANCDATENHVFSNDSDTTCDVCGYERTVTEEDPTSDEIIYDVNINGPHHLKYDEASETYICQDEDCGDKFEPGYYNRGGECDQKEVAYILQGNMTTAEEIEFIDRIEIEIVDYRNLKSADIVDFWNCLDLRIIDLRSLLYVNDANITTTNYAFERIIIHEGNPADISLGVPEESISYVSHTLVVDSKNPNQHICSFCDASEKHSFSDDTCQGECACGVKNEAGNHDFSVLDGTYHKCSVCEATFEHEFSEGTCTACGLTEAVDKFVKVQAHLEDQIGLDFKIYIPESLIEKAEKMEFDVAGVKQYVSFENAVKVTIDGQECYSFRCVLNSTQMKDTITAKMIYSDGIVGATKIYSIEHYLQKLKETYQTDAALMTLVESMSTFGDCMVAYDTNKVESIPTVTLTDKEQLYLDNYVIDTTGIDLTDTITSIKPSTARVNMGSLMSVKVRYLCDEEAAYTFFVNGEQVSAVKIAGDDGKVYYDVASPDIAPFDYGKTIKFTVKIGGIEENYVYSPMKYVKKAISQYGSNENYVSLFNSIVKYHYSVVEYEASKTNN